MQPNWAQKMNDMQKDLPILARLALHSSELIKVADANWFFVIVSFFDSFDTSLCAYPCQQISICETYNHEHRSKGGWSSVNHGENTLYTFHGMTRTNILSSAPKFIFGIRGKKMQPKLELIPFRSDKYSDCIWKAVPPDVPISIRVVAMLVLVHTLQSVNDEMCAHIYYYYYYYYFTLPTINTVGLHTTFTATSPNSQSERTDTFRG